MLVMDFWQLGAVLQVGCNSYQTCPFEISKERLFLQICPDSLWLVCAVLELQCQQLDTGLQLQLHQHWQKQNSYFPCPSSGSPVLTTHTTATIFYLTLQSFSLVY